MAEKLDFPRGKGSNIHIAVYVPSTKGINKVISKKEFNQRISQVVTFLRKVAGGTTRVTGIGDYYSDKLRKPVQEKIAKVESYTTKQDYYKVDKKIKAFLNKKKKEWSQESLAYEYEESLYFV